MSACFVDAAVQAARLAATLGWSPDAFWSATPADLHLALGLVDAEPALDAAALRLLMEALPDG